MTNFRPRMTRAEFLREQAASFLAPARSVYVMVGADKVKVGMSGDARRRRNDLAAGEPLAVAFETPTTQRAAEIEALVHRTLSPKRIRGEWFAVPEDAAIAAVKRAYDSITTGQRDPHHVRAVVA